MLPPSAHRARTLPITLALVLSGRFALAADYDVVVVGGGPAGLAAAIEAKKNGAERVLVVEKRGEARKRVQVLNLRRGTLDNLASLGVDLRSADKLTALERRLSFGLHGISFDRDVRPLRVDPNRSRHTVGDMMARNHGPVALMSTDTLEGELIVAAQRAGVEMVFDHDVTGLGHDPHSAWAEFGGKRVSAEMVVVADGAHSAARRILGIGTVGYEGKQARILGGVFAEPGGREVVGRKMPLRGGKVVGISKLGATSGAGVLAEVPADFDLTTDAKRAAYFEGAARQLGVSGATLLPPSEFLVALTNAERVVDGGRIFLIGDAARTTHVFTGLGVNWAIRDATRFGALVRKLKLARDPKARASAVSWFSTQTMRASYRLHQVAWKSFDNPASNANPTPRPSLAQIRRLGQLRP